jgi:hypothetical protein
MLRRTRRILWIIAVVLLVLAAAIYLRFKAPPEAARLLPESDGILYMNVGLARTVMQLMHTPLKPITKDPQYQKFVDATGFDAERDLDEAAIALHRMADPKGPNGPVAYSMVLEGKIDGKRLAAFLAAQATSQESYEGHTIYGIPSEGRTVRVVQIAYDTVAVSNYPSTEPIHSILDRHRTAALPFSGSTLLAEHYSEMPLLSVAWGMGQIGLPLGENGQIHLFGMSLPIPANSTFLASVHWAGELKVRIEEIADNDASASQQAADLSLLLTLTRGATAGLGANPANSGLKELLRTATVAQRRNRVVVNAVLPKSLPAELANGDGSDSRF